MVLVGAVACRLSSHCFLISCQALDSYLLRRPPTPNGSSSWDFFFLIEGQTNLEHLHLLFPCACMLHAGHPFSFLWLTASIISILLLRPSEWTNGILVGRCILHLHMHESWEDEASRPIFPLYIQINQIKSKYSTCHPWGLTYLPKQLN